MLAAGEGLVSCRAVGSEWQAKGGEKVGHLRWTFHRLAVWGAVWQAPLRDRGPVGMGPRGRALVWALAEVGLGTLP